MDSATNRLLVSTTGGAAGTEYTEGDTDTTITGTVLMWEDASDTVRAVSSAKPLPVNIVAGSSAGTEYTEDAAAAANPVGGTLIGVRADSLAGVTSADGDNIAVRMTDKGEVYVKHVDSIPVTGTFWQATQPVSAASLPLPTGAATSAKQDTIIGHVDGIEALLTTIDADTSNLSVVGGGTEAAAIRVTIASDSTGVLSVDDNGGSLTVDNAGLTELAAAINASSQMDVNLAASNATVTVASHNVTNAGTFAVQIDGAALTALQLIDDTVATLGTTTYTEAATKGSIIGAVRRDADTTLVDTTNEVGPLQMDANGRLKVEAFSGETLPVSLASVPSHAVTNAGTFAVQATVAAGATTIAKAEDVANADGDVGVPAMMVRKATPANLSGTDGDYEFLQGSAGRLWVDASGVTLTVGSHAVTNAGTFAVQAAGDVAHDTADSGSPVKVGGQARTTNPTAVADADRSNFITDKLGKQVVVGSIRDLKVQQATTITSSTSETTVLTAVASTFLDVYGVIICNTSATATDVTFKDATAGTTRFNIYVPAGDTRGFMLPESAAHNQASVNNNWTATCGTSVASIKITMFAVKNT